MSKELNELAKEFSKETPTVLRANLSLYQTSITTASSSFLREVEQTCKKLKQPNLMILVLIDPPELD